jgi:hypothetical protein
MPGIAGIPAATPVWPIASRSIIAICCSEE